MLDKRWNVVRIGLLLYGGAMVANMAMAAALAGFGLADARAVAALVLPATCVSLLLAVVSTFGVLMFATVPSESAAKVSAILAAVFALGQLAFSALPLVDLGELGALLTLLGTVCSLATLFAMLRALKSVGLYLREDDIYDRAASLSMGLGLLLLLGLTAPCVGRLAGILALVIALVVAVGALIIALGYAYLVLKTASAIKGMTAG